MSCSKPTPHFSHFLDAAPDLGRTSFFCASTQPHYLWGIVNLTPDSFYDGGKFQEAQKALAHAQKLIRAGAHVVDLGGASSRPGSTEVSTQEEWQNLASVLPDLVCHMQAMEEPSLISVDTWRSEVAHLALEAGASIINDISACCWEPGLMDVLAQHQPMYVLMHSQGRPDTMQHAPQYDNIVEEVLAFFEKRMQALTQAGLAESRILLDVGFGFGKSLEHNLTLLQNMERFHCLGRPLLAGLSNKSLFSALWNKLGLPIFDQESKSAEWNMRHLGTAAASLMLAGKGVRHHRVHQVDNTRLALALAGFE